MPFDPYHKWLGIPPDEQPPNLYRLLGISLFESDPDVIDAATEQRVTYLQQLATGNHVTESQKLLNEVSAARVCLLDSRQRAIYDAELRSKQAANEPVKSDATVLHEIIPLPVSRPRGDPLAGPPVPSDDLDDNVRTVFPIIRRLPQEGHFQWSRLNITISGCIAAGILFMILRSLFFSSLEAPVSNQISRREKLPTKKTAVPEATQTQTVAVIPKVAQTPTEVPAAESEPATVQDPEPARLEHDVDPDDPIAAVKNNTAAPAIPAAAVNATLNETKKDPASTGPKRLTPAGEWVNVLDWADLSKHAIAGNWRWEGATLAVAPQDFSRLAIPVVPVGNYELRIKLTRRQAGGSEINVVLPVGDARCMLTVGRADWIGLQNVNNSELAATGAGSFRELQQNTLYVRVLVAGVSATIYAELNDQQVLRWQGLKSELSLREVWRIHENSLGLGAHNDAVEFQSVELRMTSGEAFPVANVATVNDIPSMKWVDLLQYVNLPQHVLRGNWQRNGTGLMVRGNEFTRVAIPVAPNANYELRVGFMWVDNIDEANIILPVGKTSCMCSFSKTHVKLQSIAGSDQGTHEKALSPTDITIGARYDVHVKVSVAGSDATIVVMVNGFPTLNWQGPLNFIRPREEWRLHPNSLGLGVHQDSSVFYKADLQVLSGEAPRFLPQKTTSRSAPSLKTSPTTKRRSTKASSK